jgi:hypothetical protein
MRRNDLAFAALKHALKHKGVYALSVNTLPDLSPEEGGGGRTAAKQAVLLHDRGHYPQRRVQFLRHNRR